MRPPMCVICGRRPRDEDQYPLFQIVRFALDADEEALVRELSREGWTGHPPWLMWFCDEHLAVGEGMAHLHWRDALERLRADP